MLELRIGPEGLRVNCGSSLEVRDVRVLDSRPGIGAELRRLTFGGAAGIDILRQLWASQVFLQISQDENTQNVEELYANSTEAFIEVIAVTCDVPCLHLLTRLPIEHHRPGRTSTSTANT